MKKFLLTRQKSQATQWPVLVRPATGSWSALPEAPRAQRQQAVSVGAGQLRPRTRPQDTGVRRSLRRWEGGAQALWAAADKPGQPGTVACAPGRGPRGRHGRSARAQGDAPGAGRALPLQYLSRS